MNGFYGGVSVLTVAASLLLLSCTAPGKPKLDAPEGEALATFEPLFAMNCSGCHGMSGKGGPGRILNDPLYLSFIPKVELKKVLVYGRPGTAMPAWLKANGGSLTEHQIDTIVDGIYSSWARPFDTHGVALPPYSDSLAGSNAANGRKLFSRNCYACHAPRGVVGPVNTPSYLQLVSNQMLRTAIVVGRPDLEVKGKYPAMPNYLQLNSGRPLNSSDVNDLVGYLASLRPIPAPNEGLRTRDQGGEKGSGNGPGSPTNLRNEGHKGPNSSQAGGTVETTSPGKAETERK